MSCTEIYCVGKNHCSAIGTTQNAWLGAMYVWNDIAKRYFDLEHFPSFYSGGEEMAKRVWNAHKEHELPEHEQIVLSVTMDRVLVKADDLERLISAFEKYGQEHPNSSYKEQAEVIKAAVERGDVNSPNFIAFNQTSVCSFHFDIIDYDENDNPIFHDLEDGWDLFEQVDSILEHYKESKQ